MKKYFKKIQFVRNTYFIINTVKQFFRFKPILMLKQLHWFFSQLNKYYKLDKNSNYKKSDWYPCLFDNLKHTPLEPTYFFQDTWAAKKIFELKPKHHYDIGSSATTIGILSQFTPITMIDIRPIELELENLFFKKGSILDLPFENDSIETLSSLCVVEHIGLGRYGDPLDSFGSEKSVKEIKRVLKAGGVVLFSVPVDKKNKVLFNASRTFTREYVMQLFEGCELLEEKYHYGYKLYDHYDASKGFGTGLFMFKKK